MKDILTTYTFNAVAKTVDFSAYAAFDVKRLIAIINDKTGTVMYSVGGVKYASVSGSVVTLSYTDTGLSGTDPLTVIYDFPLITQQDRLKTDGSVSNSLDINLSSDVTLAQPSRLYINVGGNVKVDMAGSGTAQTFAVNPGAFPFTVSKVYSSANGTTATGIKAVW